MKANPRFIASRISEGLITNTYSIRLKGQRVTPFTVYLDRSNMSLTSARNLDVWDTAAVRQAIMICDPSLDAFIV